MSKIMAVNCGSSSLKFKLYEMPKETVICNGIVERIGHDDGIFQITHEGIKEKTIVPVKDHGVAVKIVMDALLNKKIIKSLDEIKATGHRVVQGGPYFDRSTEFNEDTVEKIRSLIPLAPLHNQAHLTGYEAFKKVLPNTPAIAVFDTAFHQTMEEEDYLFPIPIKYSKKYLIRRYGAHGTSHKYLSIQGEKYIKDRPLKRMIICHLGSGASITATMKGKCVATSMGLTPLGGIMMNTRTGDMDPSVYYQLLKVTGKDNETLFQELNKESGLYGVSEVSNDSRDIEEKFLKGDEKSTIAIKLWVRRVCDYIGQYYVRLGGCDLIIFSAGIGENSAISREPILKNVEKALNLSIDYKLNKEVCYGKEGLISKPDSPIRVAIIPTNEEIMLATDAYKLYLEKEKERKAKCK